MKRPVVGPLFRFIFKDWIWKLISLAAAVLLWILVASEPELSTFVTVPVQFKNLPDGIEIGSDVIESVYLELRGPSGELRLPGGELRGIDDSRRYAVVLDMSHVRPGERTFTIDEGDVKLPRGIHLVRAVPSQLRFDFEQREWRSVPVEVRFGPVQPGYELTGFTVTPPALRVEGPQSRVNLIKRVVTDPVDLSQVVGSAEFHVNCFVEDPHVRFASRSQATVNVQVRARPGAAPRRGTR